MTADKPITKAEALEQMSDLVADLVDAAKQAMVSETNPYVATDCVIAVCISKSGDAYIDHVYYADRCFFDDDQILFEASPGTGVDCYLISDYMVEQQYPDQDIDALDAEELDALRDEVFEGMDDEEKLALLDPGGEQPSLYTLIEDYLWYHFDELNL